MRRTILSSPLSVPLTMSALTQTLVVHRGDTVRSRLVKLAFSLLV